MPVTVRDKLRGNIIAEIVAGDDNDEAQLETGDRDTHSQEEDKESAPATTEESGPQLSPSLDDKELNVKQHLTKSVLCNCV